METWRKRGGKIKKNHSRGPRRNGEENVYVCLGGGKKRGKRPLARDVVEQVSQKRTKS